MRALADRNTGVGFDQLIGILPGGGDAAAELRFWNADGSEAGACGNGTRCAADVLLRERDLGAIDLRTRSGLLRAERLASSEDGEEIALDLGRPRLEWREIPLAEPQSTVAFAAPRGAAGLVAQVSAVSMGNPHCILFLEDAGPGARRRCGTRDRDRSPVSRKCQCFLRPDPGTGPDPDPGLGEGRRRNTRLRQRGLRNACRGRSPGPRGTKRPDRVEWRCATGRVARRQRRRPHEGARVAGVRRRSRPGLRVPPAHGNGFVMSAMRSPAAGADVVTLGCRLNALESERIAARKRERPASRTPSS